MIQFNELRVTSDGRHIIVDVAILPMDYYENVVLDTIVISTRYVDGGTSPDNSTFIIDCNDSKHYRVFRDIDGMGNQLFFVYVTTKGEPAEDTPCGMKTSAATAVTYNKCPIYNTIMSLLRELDDCNPPGDLLNIFFQYKAFQLALDTGNYTKAVLYWNKFFNTDKPTSTIKRCGCHG